MDQSTTSAAARPALELLREKIETAVSIFGSQRAAFRELGIARTTAYNILKGSYDKGGERVKTTVRPATTAKVDTGLSDKGITIKRGPHTVTINAKNGLTPDAVRRLQKQFGGESGRFTTHHAAGSESKYEYETSEWQQPGEDEDLGDIADQMVEEDETLVTLALDLGGE